MISVAICDDDNSCNLTINNIIKSFSIKHDVAIEVKYIINDPFKLLDYIQDNYIDICILDIDFKLDSINGIQLAKKIRELQSSVTIIFISARLERIFESYECIPFSFICKPSISVQLEETLLRYIKYRCQLQCGNFIKIKQHIFNAEHIIYIEKNLSIAKIFTSTSVTSIYISFKEFLSCLPDNFIQIHKSFIVNTHFIIEINLLKKYILLSNNVKIRYSNKFLKEIGDIKLCNN